MSHKALGPAFLITGFAIVAAIALLLVRGGLIAWGTFFLGVALLTKIRLKPSAIDLVLSLGLIVIPALAWIGTFYWVIGTWESGEVVELSIETDSGDQTVRVWVLDSGSHPLVYYDAPAAAARSLLSGRPLQYTRAGEVSLRTPEATPADALPEEEAAVIFETMVSKYGDRVGAADIYYLMLGRPRDRVALVIRLIE